MRGLEVVVLVGLILVVGTRLSSVIHVPAPLVLLVLGSVGSFVPFAPSVGLPAGTVLLVFLPALLFYEASTISIREIRNNIGAIAWLSVGLVTLTAGGVAVLAHTWGLSWPMSWVVGAIVAPTDSTALGAVVSRLPRRELTTLKAESLVNDGTALVIYSIAVSVAAQGHRSPTALGVAGRLVGSYAGGIAIGLAVAFVMLFVHRLLNDTRLESALGVLTPFLAYLPAEEAGVSGVVAVVSCGLAQSRYGSIVGARARQQSQGFWQIGTYLLNGALFVLIGLEFHRVIDAMVDVPVMDAMLDGLTASAVVITVRVAWFMAAPDVTRIEGRRAARRLRWEAPRRRLPLAWAGFRGAVSLAAALGLPLTRVDGTALPHRELVLFITYVLIFTTLALQSLTMHLVVGWAQLVPDDEDQEQRLAERTIAEAAVEALPRRAREHDVEQPVVEALRSGYQGELDRLAPDPERGDAPRHRSAPADPEERVRASLIVDQRRALAGLRDHGLIDDVVLRRVQTDLDAEELRLEVAPTGD
jgi:Na+/H+ antiporter